jgi:hypothetical protein
LALFFAVLTAVQPAVAQDSIMQRVGTVVDSFRKYVESLGQKTENILPPAFSLDDAISNTFSGLKTFVAPFDESYPVSAAPRIAIEGEFGEIRVTAWDQPVVRVQADITAGAETTEKAMAIAQGIKIGVTPHEGGLDVRTQYPEAPIEINYTISVPRDANVQCKNRLGDTVVHGVGGDVTVDSTIGRVELKDLARPVRVLAQGGSQPLFAFGLKQGGDFALRDVQAEFAGVAGSLKINNFMGKVTLRELPPECQVEATSIGGPVEVQLSQTDRPHVEATALYGDIASDLDLKRVVRSSIVQGQNANDDSKQRLRIDTTFENIAVHVQGVAPAAPVTQPAAGGTVEEPIPEQTFPVAAGVKLVVEGIVGDIRIKGAETDTLTVSATKHVRVNAPADAPAALEALVLEKAPAEGAMRIATTFKKDPAELGCTSYRVDLTIICPKGMPVEVHGRSGHTTVEDMAAPVKAVQDEGALLAQNSTGDLDLRVLNGEVDALDCGGAVNIDLKSGRASTRNAKGKQTIVCHEGKKVVVDAPMGEVNVKSTGGDVNIIALNGIGGNYDINVEKGNLSIMLLPTSDAMIFATTERGRVDVNNANGLALTGTIGKDSQQLQGRMSNGQFRVALTAKDGNIALD